jgi:hypothetical protein
VIDVGHMASEGAVIVHPFGDNEQRHAKAVDILRARGAGPPFRPNNFGWPVLFAFCAKGRVLGALGSSLCSA